jgi:hypothetical protein
MPYAWAGMNNELWIYCQDMSACKSCSKKFEHLMLIFLSSLVSLCAFSACASQEEPVPCLKKTLSKEKCQTKNLKVFYYLKILLSWPVFFLYRCRRYMYIVQAWAVLGRSHPLPPTHLQSVLHKMSFVVQSAKVGQEKKKAVLCQQYLHFRAVFKLSPNL